MAQDNSLLISSSPHIRTKDKLPVVMWSVVIALIPAGVWSYFVFGISAIITIGVSVGAAVLTELIINLLIGKRITVINGSAFLTGLLIAYNLPASAGGHLPIYIPIVASVFAIAVIKLAFGGLGQNWMNPALGGRIFVFFAWTRLMTSGWAAPMSPDVVSSATPLAALKFNAGTLPTHLDLFLGKTSGCIGEVSAAALILGGVFLIIRKIVNWEIPVFYILTTAILAWIFGGLNASTPALFTGDPLYHILSGGLMLGAIFMATDWVTSPMLFKGRVLFAVGCGIITVLIRLTGRNVEGVSFAIVLMNIAVPLIDRLFRLGIFGTPGKEKKA